MTKQFFDLVVYAIKDRKADMYNLPFCVPNPDGSHSLAKRAFLTMLQNPDNPMSSFPNDFSLHAINEFNQETAKFGVWDDVDVVCDGNSLLIQYRSEYEQTQSSSPSTDT